MNIETYRHKGWLTNCYLITSDEANAIMIDAGAPCGSFSIHCEEKLKAIFITHHHHDHTACLHEWRERFPGAKIYSPQSLPKKRDGVKVGDITVEILYTPGHTKDHFSFLVNKRYLFTGDLLFKGATGSTVADGTGSYRDLKNSILDLIVPLSGDIIVYPGHMDPTTVGNERNTNPFILFWRGEKKSLNEKRKIKGRNAILHCVAKDYDGGRKGIVEFCDREGAEFEIVPGSWLR